jgi:aspartate ammonia-lyase
LPLRPARSLFRVTQSMGDVLTYSSAMRRLSVELGKIASDLRLLSMGPRAGLSEIVLPAVQPGSSIMPGKVNPSIPEMVNQVCFQVTGCDATVAMACEAGQLELNVMMPVIAWNALHASTILERAMHVLRERTIEGLRVDAARARELLDRSSATATALSPYIGYAATAEIAKEAVATGRPIRDLALERGVLDAARLDDILSVDAMTGRAGGAGKAGAAGRAGTARRTDRAGAAGKTDRASSTGRAGAAGRTGAAGKAGKIGPARPGTSRGAPAAGRRKAARRS